MIVGASAFLLLVATEAAAQGDDRPDIQLSVTGRTLTLVARDAPLVDVLRLIARRLGAGLAASGDLGTRVTVAFESVEVDEAVASLSLGHATVRLLAPWASGSRELAFSRTPTRDAAGSIADRVEAHAGDRWPAPADPVTALPLRPSDPALLERLRQLLDDSADPILRARAILGLGTGRDPNVAGVPRSGTTDVVGAERIQAIFALGHVLGAESIPVLAHILTIDSDFRTRLAAARALSSLPGAGATAALALGIRDPHESVRREIEGLLMTARAGATTSAITSFPGGARSPAENRPAGAPR